MGRREGGPCEQCVRVCFMSDTALGVSACRIWRTLRRARPNRIQMQRPPELVREHGAMAVRGDGAEGGGDAFEKIRVLGCLGTEGRGAGEGTVSGRPQRECSLAGSSTFAD